MSWSRGAPKASGALPPAPLVAGVAGSKTLAIAASIWLLGGVTGAALYGALRPSRKCAWCTSIDRRRPRLRFRWQGACSDLRPAGSVTPLSATSNRPAVGRAALPSASGAVSPRRCSQLAQERALLDLARSNAARGEPGAARSQQVERHREQFPHGRLAEEREALGIRALLSLGRKQEAQERAQAFRALYPNSFLLPVIDSALSAP